MSNSPHSHRGVQSRTALLKRGWKLWVGLCVVTVSLLMGSAAAAPLVNDPRCADYVCDLSNRDPSFYVDPSECDSDTCTETCLGADYASVLKDLGQGTAPRHGTIWLPMTNWLSSQFPNMIFKIIAREVLGFTVKSAVMNDGRSVLCCPDTVAWLENWPGDPFPSDRTQGSLYKLPNGYLGYAGLYIPNYVLDQYPLATAYMAYKTIPEYSNIFPRAFSMPINETLMNQSEPIVDSNQWCSEAKDFWTHTNCTNGSYVPPQCVANTSACQEIMYGEPVWDTGFFEGVVKNLGLNFTFVYVGVDNAFTKVAEYADQRKNFIFYMSGPDPILAKVPSQRMNLPPQTLWCDESKSEDPTLNGANCSYPDPVLYKTTRASDMQADEDLKHFFDSLQFSPARIQAFMAQHTSGGGTQDVWNISCSWVRANLDTWKPWAINTPPPQSSDANKLIPIIAGVAGGIGGFLVIGGVIFFLYQRHQAMKATENAPVDPPLTLIFTDVESSTNLWEAYPEMAIAMEMHHEIIRKQIAEYQCYEVKTIGDSFMIACSSLSEAVSLSMSIQRKLFEADWPSCLKYWKGDEDSQPGMWNGLRVRAGIHLCHEVKPELDTVHGRYDYYGHDVNVSARVESMAAGGQIMMTQETFQSLTEDPDFEALCEEMACVPFCKGAELKGVAGKVVLYSLTPLELSGRQFKPIPGTEPCMTADGIAEVGSTSGSATASVVAESTSTLTTVLRKHVEDILAFLPNASEKDKAVTQLLVKYKIVNNASETKGLKFPRKLQLLLRYIGDSLPLQGAQVRRGSQALLRGMSMSGGKGLKLQGSMMLGSSALFNAGLGSGNMSPQHGVEGPPTSPPFAAMSPNTTLPQQVLSPTA